jgi:transmembrane sensor
MSSLSSETEDDTKAAALSWLLRLSIESATLEDRAHFTEWCNEDPRHIAAYRRFHAIWQASADLKDLLPLTAPRPQRHTFFKRLFTPVSVPPLAWTWRVGVIVIIGCFGAWMFLGSTQYSTRIGEIREIRLTDGSIVTLGARSALDVKFEPAERRVILISGEAFFSVAKNKERPFIVSVGDKEIRVVGTQFDVCRGTDNVRVSVAQGIVEVRSISITSAEDGSNVAESARSAERSPSRDTGAGQASPDGRFYSGSLAVITAGEMLRAGLPGPINPPEAMTHSDPAAWVHGHLAYVDTPLREVLADANRYSRQPVAVADEKLGATRVSVTYPSDRVDQMLAALSRSLDLDVVHERDRIVLKTKGASD